MKISERIEDRIVVLHLSGDFWSTGDWQLYDHIKEKVEDGFNQFILDFTMIQRINSMGIGVMVASMKAAQDKGGGLKLVGVVQNVKDVLQVVNLYTIIEFYDTVEDAIHSFQNV